MSGSTLFAGLVFGAIGTAACIYGKKRSELKPTIVGVAMIIYPYFVSNAWLLWGIGAILTAALFFWVN